VERQTPAIGAKRLSSGFRLDFRRAPWQHG
jgi:hypothetical protein